MSVKLIVADMAIRSRYVSREFVFVMRQLIKAHGWRHIESRELLTKPAHLRDRLRAHCGAMPDVVLFWEAYEVAYAAFRQLYKIDCRVATLCDDLHWFNNHTRDRKQLAFVLSDVILSTYAPVFDRYYPELSRKKRVVWVPHAASPDFILPINKTAENGVLLSGKVSRRYPLRQQMKRLHDRRALNIVHHPHPGYRCNFNYERSRDVGCGYARRINQYRAAFTDASQFQYVLAKFFEIPATGALLLADRLVERELSSLGFQQSVHYVPVCSQSLEDTVQHLLDEKNHGELDQIRRNGQQLVWQRHQTADRARLINDACTAP